MTTPRFSVIVPFYNASPYIGTCIESLLQQDYPARGFELIFIDNNSTDDSAAIVRKYPEVQLLAEPKQGAYAARNRGVQQARGGLLAFTDPDCLACPTWLLSFEQALAKPEVLLAVGCRRPAREGTLLSRLQDYDNAKDEFVLGSDEKLLYYGHTNNMVVRREAFDRWGPFVERRRGSDAIFVRRVVDGDSCGAVVYEPRAVVRHMELESAFSYCQKMFIYGRGLRSRRQAVEVRPLRFSERKTVLRNVVRRCNYNLGQRLELTFALGTAMAAWTLGTWAGALKAPEGR